MKKQINKLISAFILLSGIAILTSCDKDEDTAPTTNRYHDCTMWQYLKSNPDNWDSTALLIERAGLIPLFDGKDTDHPEITFFGPKNFSVLQFLLKTTDNKGKRLYQSINDIPVELCRRMVLSYVIASRRERTSFDFEKVGTLEGGTELNNLSGVLLRIYQTKSDWYGVPDAGPNALYIHAKKSGHIALISTSDLEMQNGFVHALSTTFQLTEL